MNDAGSSPDASPSDKDGQALPVGKSAPEFTGVDPQLVLDSEAVAAPATPGVRKPADYKWQALRTRYLSSRYPLAVVSVALLLVCIPRISESLVQVVANYPAAGTAAVVLWALYAFPLIWLINRFDFFEREPTILIAMAMAWGGIIASTMAVTANEGAFSLLTSWFGEDFAQQWGPALAAPTTEELLKALGIVAVSLLALRGIRSAIDGFVVGAMVGLGFQVVENFVYTGNLLLATGDLGNPFGAVLDVFLVRGVGAGLWSHAVYSGVAGLGIGYALTRRDKPMGRRVATAAVMLALSWFMHFVWNFPQLQVSSPAFVSVFKAAIILGLLAIVIQRNQRRESFIYTDYLAVVQDPEIITPAEIEQLRTYRTREAAVAAAGRRGGEKVADAVRQRQRAQANLSVALATGDMPRVAQAKRRIALARRRRAAAELLPPDVAYGWGLASIWMSIIGLLVPIIGALIAMALAAVGTYEARSRGAGMASTVRAAWPIAGLSLLVGVVLLLVI